ncbi:alpha-1,6-mannosyl-glycoprotein 2-beta-N-acetylglucosaminyltransferase-like isoform X2 [Macrobrachium nipponense]|uniref:alpha-1,6-mannosyl-glycoprotein 2-beta-N-acetylglucosaminyltransferase-like isoform X2 n=1 Tax=Macrobrachium nipponense TaxID=159736 RepID=UPI0030C8CA96
MNFSTATDAGVSSNQSHGKLNSTIAPTATISHTEIKDHSKSAPKPTRSSKDVEIEEEIKRIKKNVQEINNRQLIRNENVFGPVGNDTRIFIVQVHRRLENLRYLVESLGKVKGINESLVILSHDFWDPTINDFVGSITSFRVLQMFFPFSVQLYPNTFPGRGPQDCERNAKGVFEDLQISKQWDGWIIFLEEDHFVAPDILYVLNALVTSRTSLCFHCRVICLGNYKPKLSSGVNMVGIGDWVVTKQNMGFAMDRSAWNSIKACGEIFCVFDDYNWDWTMNRLVQTCCFPKLTAMFVDVTRVVHVGSCGTHIKEARCDVSKAVMRAKALFWANRHFLFPKSFARLPFSMKLPPFKRPNGGWGDLRDRQLCKAIGNGTASEDTLLRLRFNPRPGRILQQSREGR